MSSSSDQDDESFSEHSLDSDNESPEDISFKSSKDDALSSIISIKETLSRDKQDQKHHRKAIELRNIEQKKSKTLSVGFLDQVDKVMEENKAVKRLMVETRDEEVQSSITKGRKNVYTGKDRGNVVPVAKIKRYSKQPDISAVEFKNKILYRSENKRIDHSTKRSLEAKRFQRFQTR